MKASSVSKRGSVFDSPFTTSAHHAEHTPLRHYENDSFAVFGELPQRRRRPRAVDTEHWIRFSMKAILLSPVVVLVVWSLFLATKTTSSVHSKSRSSVLPARSRGDKGRFPVVAPLGAEGPVRTNNNNNIVQPVYYSRAQEQQLYAPQQQQQFQQQQQVMNTPQQPMAPMAVANAQGQPMLMAPQVVQNPQQQQQQVMMMAPAQQQQQQQFQQQQQLVEQQQLPQQALPEQQTIPPQARTEQMSQQQQQPEPMQQQPQETPLAGTSQQAPVRYYYYDPAKTQQDPSGNLILPDTVYDSQGRAIPTAQLSGSITAAQQPQLESTGSTSNATPVAEPHKELAIPTALAASTSLPADQSIIVGTVGVMALLVGALSARRLRSRGVLQVCLDDAVDDDAVAYDGAYTVASGPTYGTWKGDLEKFDV